MPQDNRGYASRSANSGRGYRTAQSDRGYDRGYGADHSSRGWYDDGRYEANAPRSGDDDRWSRADRDEERRYGSSPSRSYGNRDYRDEGGLSRYDREPQRYGRSRSPQGYDVSEPDYEQYREWQNRDRGYDRGRYERPNLERGRSTRDQNADDTYRSYQSGPDRSRRSRLGGDDRFSDFSRRHSHDSDWDPIRD